MSSHQIIDCLFSLVSLKDIAMGHCLVLRGKLVLVLEVEGYDLWAGVS